VRLPNSGLPKIRLKFASVWLKKIRIEFKKSVKLNFSVLSRKRQKQKGTHTLETNLGTEIIKQEP
jgi:hypothetical protein